MADKFNVDAGVRPAPNLMPSAGGVGGNPGNPGAGIASLFDGFGSLFKGIVQGQEAAKLNAISGEVGQNIDYQMTNNIDSRKVPDSTAPSTQEAPPVQTETLENPRTGLLTEQPKPVTAPASQVAGETNLQIPAEVKAAGRTADTWTAAHNQGKMSDYWLRMSTLQRDLEAKYGPQYAPAIRQMFKDRIGVIPSQKYVETMQKEQEEAQRNLKDEESRWRTDKSDAAGLGIPANKLREGDSNPLVREQIRTEVLNRKAENAKTEATIKALDLKKKQGEDIQNDVLRVARGVTNQLANNVMGDVNASMEAEGFSLRKITEMKQKALANDGVIDDNELRTITQATDQLRTNFMMRWNKEMTPFFERIEDPRKFDELRKEALERITFFTDNITKGNTGILEWNETARKSMQAGDEYMLGRNSQSLRELRAYNQVGGQIAADLYIRNNAPTLNNEAKRNNILPRYGAIGGDTVQGKPFSESIKNHTEGLSAPDKAAVINGSLNETTRQILDPKSPPDIVRNQAAALFAQGKGLTLKEFSPESQMKVFNTLASPAMMVKMQELSKDDPKVYENYREWVQTSTYSMLGEKVANLKNVMSNSNSTKQMDNNLVIGFDGTQFTVSVNPQKARLSSSGEIVPIDNSEDKQTPLFKGTLGPNGRGVDKASMKVTIESVRDINRALQLALPVLTEGKGAGMDPKQILEPFFGGIGVTGVVRNDLEYVAQAYNQWKLSETQVEGIAGESPLKAPSPMSGVTENPRTGLTPPAQNLADPNLPASDADLPPSEPLEQNVSVPASGEANQSQGAQDQEGYWVPRLQPNGKYQDVFVRKDGTPALNPDGTPMTKEQMGKVKAPEPAQTPSEQPQEATKQGGGVGVPAATVKPATAAPKAAEKPSSAPAPRAVSNPQGLRTFANAEQANNNPMSAGYIIPDDGSYNPGGQASAPAGGDRNTSAPVATGAPMNLLSLIGKVEAGPKQYNSVYAGAKTSANLTGMTIAEVLALQDKIKGSGSTAVGRYQFINKTLKGLVKEMGLNPDTKFTPEVQDSMAMMLLRRRGLNDYLRGKISEDQFADNLSKEWAALPYKTGKSFYDGDKVGNKSRTSREQVLAMIRNLKGGIQA